MEWQDDAIVLAVRRHAENDAILSALTLEHGRHAGLVHGGAGKRAGPLLQPGNRLSATWRARLAEQLGHYRVEPVQLFAARLVHDPARLLGLASACALLEEALPEREAHPRLYAGLLRLLETMVQNENTDEWPETYVRFELLLLSDLGFGLDFGSCAVTGTDDDLAYVSPKTGRAVGRGAAGAFAPRLLPLPGFLRGAGEEGAPGAAEIAAGLRLTGHFLAKHVFAPADRPLPAARERLADRLARDASENGTP